MYEHYIYQVHASTSSKWLQCSLSAFPFICMVSANIRACENGAHLGPSIGSQCKLFGLRSSQCLKTLLSTLYIQHSVYSAQYIGVLPKSAMLDKSNSRTTEMMLCRVCLCSAGWWRQTIYCRTTKQAQGKALLSQTPSACA